MTFTVYLVDRPGPVSPHRSSLSSERVALAPALQWLNGWQKYEARTAEALAAAGRVLTPPASEMLVAAEPVAEPVAEEPSALEDLE